MPVMTSEAREANVSERTRTSRLWSEQHKLGRFGPPIVWSKTPSGRLSKVSPRPHMIGLVVLKPNSFGFHWVANNLHTKKNKIGYSKTLLAAKHDASCALVELLS